jgi:hypothetical protein
MRNFSSFLGRVRTTVKEDETTSTRYLLALGSVTLLKESSNMHLK